MESYLVVGPANLQYLFNFVGLSPEEHEAYGLVTKTKKILMTDGRYITREGKKNGLYYRLLTRTVRLQALLQKICAEERITRLGFEKDHFFYKEYEELKAALPQVELVPLEDEVRKRRAIKTEAEMKMIRKACELSDELLKRLQPLLKLGLTEREILHTLQSLAAGLDSELAFDPIVAVDADSALPHYNTKTGNGTIKTGSVLLIDMGLRHQGYVSDITRQFFFGRPKPELMRRYEAICMVQEKATQSLLRRTQYAEVDADCRKVQAESGLPDCPHSTGHGIGLEIHELPYLSATSSDQKMAGQVVTIEPGAYFPGQYGLRVEDSVAITPQGIEILTKTTKEPIIL